jgi:hypothetical protein
MRPTPVELGTFSADAAGVVTADLTIPPSAEAGSHTLTFSGLVTGDLAVPFRLAAAEQEPEPAGEPASSSADGTLSLVLGGTALLLAAVGLVWHRRRSARPGGPQPPAGGQPTETPIAEPIA